MDEQGRISELGRMLGGGSAATDHARHLLLSTTSALRAPTTT
jgi:DNA repair ATPase RecN